MSDWESTFQTWGKAPGVTEQTKCENAERAIRKAIDASSALSKRNIKIFAQGSYRNRTNAPGDSDVDVCILCSDSTFYDLPEGTTIGQFGMTTPAKYQYDTFKNDVQNALINHFGSTSVKRGEKAFDIHENTYRIDADVIACFEYRRYENAANIPIKGTAFIPDGFSTKTINWPEQNYNNGVTKNDQTGKRFKAMVRILKQLRMDMADSGIEVASKIPSFLLECLVWNVPNEGFGHDTFTADVRYCITWLWNNMKAEEQCHEWGEINELKYLFRPTQPWTRDQVNEFLVGAWNHLEFE
jgi:hypothetical protein